MNQENYYQILNVSPDVAQAEIKAAYREMAKKFHPDINREQGSEEIFKIIQEAYEVLSDPERRRQYDETLRQSSSARHFEYDATHDMNTAAEMRYSVPRLSLVSVLRKITAVIFLAIIPVYSFLNGDSMNNILIYYGWLLVLYLFTKLIYGLTCFGILVWFLISLFNGQGFNLLWAIIAWAVVTAIVWFLNPSVFEQF